MAAAVADLETPLKIISMTVLNFDYAIAQLNVSRAHLAITIDKWDKEIMKHGPDEHSVNFYNDAKKKLDEIEQAIQILTNLKKQ